MAIVKEAANPSQKVSCLLLYFFLKILQRHLSVKIGTISQFSHIFGSSQFEARTTTAAAAKKQHSLLEERLTRQKHVKQCNVTI